MPAPGVRRHDNLPAHRVHLFGRKHDLAMARTEQLRTEGRLLTMTGTGGCGKTHLFRMADHPPTKARVNDWTKVAKKTLGHPYREQSEPNTTG
jgi:type II secretory pathway predicted ATPase ExeA